MIEAFWLKCIDVQPGGVLFRNLAARQNFDNNGL